MLFYDGIIFSLQAQGGISVYYQEILKRLSAHAINFKLLVYSDCVNNKFFDDTSYIRRSKRFAERYRNSPVIDSAKLFHSSYYRLPESRHVKVVTTVHDFTYEYFISGLPRATHSWQKFRAIRGSDAVICVSENTMRDLFYFLPDYPKEKVFVVHNGVSELFYPLHIPVGTDRPYVLFVGRRDFYKNFSVAVDVVAKIEGVVLRCVGGGAFASKELALLERQLPGRYRHMGAVSTEELNILYNGALCLLYPSSYEGFGIPVLEAMRSGCPVVAINASSIPEVVGDAALLVDSAQTDLLVHAIETLQNSSFRAEMRSRGIVRATCFSWDKCFEGTVRVYEELLGEEIL